MPDKGDLQICPRKGIISVASYDSPWKIFGRRNEIWWAERPKRHNDSSLTFGEFEVESLFPEEFPQLETRPDDGPLYAPVGRQPFSILLEVPLNNIFMHTPHQ